jgi:hypothetical protein
MTARKEGDEADREMVRLVLQAAGQKGMRPKEITDFVRKRWWPDVPSNRMATTAHSMLAAGELRRHGERYRLLNGHAGEE